MTHPFRNCLLAVLALCALVGRLPAQSSATASHPDSNPAILVELFTSEGCSSCPPADALLRELNDSYSHSGDLIVGLSEHVSYWDDLGWRDRFATAASTNRQRDYGQRFHLDGVFTPQAVVNGEQQMVGSDRGALLHAIEAARHPAAVSLRITSLTVDKDGLSASFRLSGTLPGATDIYAVIAQDEAVSSVLRGENSGLTLRHVAVATSLTRIATLSGASERVLHLPLPAATPSRHLLLFAQQSGLGPVLAIASRPI